MEPRVTNRVRTGLEVVFGLVVLCDFLALVLATGGCNVNNSWEVPVTAGFVLGLGAALVATSRRGETRRDLIARRIALTLPIVTAALGFWLFVQQFNVCL